MKRVFRFIKSLWKYILYGKRVNFNEFVYRIGICNKCECLNEDNWTCNKCGCYVLKKNKMSTEKCPKGYW